MEAVSESVATLMSAADVACYVAKDLGRNRIHIYEEGDAAERHQEMQWVARMGRRVYLACELPVYYPGERLIAPDILAVLDVGTHERAKWVVKQEGKGLDLAIEVLVSGHRRKDLEDNVVRYAALGITEYFVLDRGRLRLFGYRLPSPEARVYQPIVPQGGRYGSHVLGLDLHLEGTKLRFYQGSAPVLEASEIIASLVRMMGDVEGRVRAAEERAEEEARRREEEVRRREEAERARDEAHREIARLRALLDKR